MQTPFSTAFKAALGVFAAIAIIHLLMFLAYVGFGYGFIQILEQILTARGMI